MKKTSVPAFRAGASFKELVAAGKVPKVDPGQEGRRDQDRRRQGDAAKATAAKATAAKATSAAGQDHARRHDDGPRRRPRTAATKTAPARKAAAPRRPAKRHEGRARP